MTRKLRPLAIVLPQFHPIPENDEWWGKGFTDWTNVTKATPRFRGHYQPHLPADLGFYDLRLEDSRIAQAALAKEYGIEGFCYYHYWFNGKQVLERPVNEILESGKPDFPFCLCWANESWSRRWDGMEQDILLKQEYSFDDDREHIRSLFKTFADKRYIRIDNKPVFIVYRPTLFPDIKRTTDIWREEFTKAGMGELYLAYMQSFSLRTNPSAIGFDAAIEFQPDFDYFPQIPPESRKDRMLRKLKKLPYEDKDKVFDYGEVVDMMQKKRKPGYKIFPGIFPMWDNSARKKIKAYIVHGSTPDLYEKWLTHVVNSFEPYAEEENLVFINAWNEWAEGNHLEPCQKWGRAYLEKTKAVLKG